MDNEVIISKEVLGVLKFASNSGSRPILEGVLIQDGKIVCADGFKLAEGKVKQYKGFPNCVLNADQILKAGFSKLSGQLTISYNNGQYVAHGEYDIVVEPIIGNYPKYEKLYEGLNNKPVLASIGLNVAYLRRLAESFELSGHEAVSMQFRGYDQPIEFCAGIDESFKGLIMPMATQVSEMPWISNEYRKVEVKESN